MTDDIVTRLREHALEGIWDFTKCSWDIQEAADEIERLRSELDQLWSHDTRLLDQRAELQNEIKRLRHTLALTEKWRNNYKIAFEKERKNAEYWHGKAIDNGV